MQTFICPKCGHESTYDPWIGSAHCPECDHKPDTRRGAIHRRRPPQKRTATYQPLLDELLAHWNGTHTPDPDFTIQTADLALAFFRDCQRMLGEEPGALAGYMEFWRNYQPKQSEILMFVGAYLLLKQGNRAEAARHLRALTTMVRKFPDPWIWLTATTDDPAERKEYLENAVMLNPAKADRKMLMMARERAGALTTQAPQSSLGPVMLRRSFQTSSSTYQLVLLPVWVALLRADHDVRLALVNGQTGKVAFGPPLPGDQG